MTTVVTNGTAPRSDLAECARDLAERFMVSGVAIGQVQEPAQPTRKETREDYARRKSGELVHLLNSFQHYKLEDRIRLLEGHRQAEELTRGGCFSGDDGACRLLTELVNQAKSLQTAASEDYRQRQLARSLALHAHITQMEVAAALDLVTVLASLGCDVGPAMFGWLPANDVRQALATKWNTGRCTHQLNLLEQYWERIRPAQINGSSPTPARRHILRKQEKSENDRALRARMKGPSGQRPPKGKRS